MMRNVNELLMGAIGDPFVTLFYEVYEPIRDGFATSTPDTTSQRIPATDPIVTTADAAGCAERHQGGRMDGRRTDARRARPWPSTPRRDGSPQS